MSWSYNTQGKKQAVINFINRQNGTSLSYIEERKSFDLVKEAILLEVSVIRDNQYVSVEANGSMWVPVNGIDPCSISSTHKVQLLYILEE